MKPPVGPTVTTSPTLTPTTTTNETTRRIRLGLRVRGIAVFIPLAGSQVTDVNGHPIPAFGDMLLGDRQNAVNAFGYLDCREH